MDAIIQLNESHCKELGRLNRLLIEDEGHGNPMSPDQLAERMRNWLATDDSGRGSRRLRASRNRSPGCDSD